MSLLRNIGIGRTKLITEWVDQNMRPFQSPSYSYTIDDDFRINVEGSVVLHSAIKEFPDYIQFGKVHGNFVISWCPYLVSLRGCPKEVVGDFKCLGCTGLTNLVGAPEIVYGTLDLSNSYNLESIEGLPKYAQRLNTRGTNYIFQTKLWEKYHS